MSQHVLKMVLCLENDSTYYDGWKFEISTNFVLSYLFLYYTL